MDDRHLLACVIYAAKSTEDRRGSIPDQLRECREAIEADPGREVIAEYQDEAFSAYHRDRGPGLREALVHAEDLAAEYGLAELWVQHSDRLARGDGRNARHTVEIALWALKQDVKIRSLQDPDTFRDLLYAVVTGQRNNEDSKRKALACQAGMRRAVARGEYVGHLPDGYRVAVDVDEHGQVRKRMVLDPSRQPLIALIFRLALRGRNCGQIAAIITNAGWLTKPVKKHTTAKPFDLGRVYEILKNPRYASLAVRGGEILARGHWPAYISERQYERIKRQLATPRPHHSRLPLESYLLSGFSYCGVCGYPLNARTWRQRSGGLHRTYLCASYSNHRGSLRCDTRPIDAHTAEAMVIAGIATLLAATTSAESGGEEVFGGLSASAPVAGPRSRLRAAVLEGNETQIDETLELLFASMQADAALLRGQAISQRLHRELAQIQQLRVWIEQESHERTPATRAEAPELNLLLRKWFTNITLTVHPDHVVVAATRRQPSLPPGDPVEVRINRAAWTRRVRPHCRQLIHGCWGKPEIIGALQAFADQHGRSPTWVDWTQAGGNHPQALTLGRHFTSWNHALAEAGLEAVPAPVHYAWTSEEVIKALKTWAHEHGHPPVSTEWARARPEHPCTATVYAHFDGWNVALAAAGLEPEPRLTHRVKPWYPEDILRALQAWNASYGRPPAAFDWRRAAAGHPQGGTVAKYFGNWDAALAAAGLAAPAGTPSPAA